jgi:membrane-associated phospholipid phosphatase
MVSSFDLPLLEWIQKNRVESLDEILRIFSYATTYISISLILTVGFVYRFNRTGLRKLTQMVVVFLIAALTTWGVKSIVNRTRPFRAHDSIEKLIKGGGNSFPSGHTTETFAIATTIALLFRRRMVQVAVFTWALLVGYSRIALGVHYPSDVLGGMLIGICLALLVDYCFRRWINPP